MSGDAGAVRQIDWEAGGLSIAALSRGPEDGPLALYLHGSEDGCLRWEMVQAAVARYPDGWQHQLFAGAGHFLHLEQPKAVNAAILAFVGDP